MFSQIFWQDFLNCFLFYFILLFIFFNNFSVQMFCFCISYQNETFPSGGRCAPFLFQSTWINSYERQKCHTRRTLDYLNLSMCKFLIHEKLAYLSRFSSKSLSLPVARTFSRALTVFKHTVEPYRLCFRLVINTDFTY